MSRKRGITLPDPPQPEPPAEIPELEPADPERCQCDITPPYNPFQLGAQRKPPQRCTNKPIYIATEKQPGPDGATGSMSICVDCYPHLTNKDKYELTPI